MSSAARANEARTPSFCESRASTERTSLPCSMPVWSCFSGSPANDDGACVRRPGSVHSMEGSGSKVRAAIHSSWSEGRESIVVDSCDASAAHCVLVGCGSPCACQRRAAHLARCRSALVHAAFFPVQRLSAIVVNIQKQLQAWMTGSMDRVEHGLGRRGGHPCCGSLRAGTAVAAR